MRAYIPSRGGVWVQALAVRDITKFFGPVRALRGVTLTVARGEALAIFGPNGAGKTTLLKIASTLMRPSSGQVLLFGADPRQAPQRLPIARPLVHSPQSLLLDEPYTGLDRSSAAAFTELLMAMRGSRTIVLTTHSIEQGVALSDRVAIAVC